MYRKAGFDGFWDRFLSSSRSPSYHNHLGRRPSSNWFWNHGLSLSNRLWLWAVPFPCLFLSQGLYPLEPAVRKKSGLPGFEPSYCPHVISLEAQTVEALFQHAHGHCSAIVFSSALHRCMHWLKACGSSRVQVRVLAF